MSLSAASLLEGRRARLRGRPAEDVSESGARYAKTLATAAARGARSAALASRAGRSHRRRLGLVDVYLRALCTELGVEVICTELASKAGRLTGRCAGGDCTGSEKARRVRCRYDLSRYPVIYAYGGTEEDRELLGLASKRYLRWREVPA